MSTETQYGEKYAKLAEIVAALRPAVHAIAEQLDEESLFERWPARHANDADKALEDLERNLRATAEHIDGMVAFVQNLAREAHAASEERDA